MKTTQTWKIGDSKTLIKEIADNTIDLVVTDPPYKVSQNYGNAVDANNLMGVASIYKVFYDISRVLKEGRFFACFYDNRILPVLFDAIKDTGLVYRKTIYLYRRWGNANRWVGWMQCTDPCCIFVKGVEKPFSPKVNGRKVKHDCYIKDKPELESTGHPAQKPIDMIKDIVSWCSEEGDTVLDPYCGSGTTLKACQELNRNCIGFEMNLKYEEMIKKRLAVTTPTLLTEYKEGT